MPSDFEWTDVAVRRLRSLWDEGHSTAEIGRRLGVSKNAVVGKAHRLDLPDRPSPIRKGSAPRPRAAPRPRPSLPPLPSLKSAPLPVVTAYPQAPVPGRILAALMPASVPSLGTRVMPCCWPIGQPGKPGFRFCEADSVPGRPYCDEHCRDAYVNMRRRKAA